MRTLIALIKLYPNLLGDKIEDRCVQKYLMYLQQEKQAR